MQTMHACMMHVFRLLLPTLIEGFGKQIHVVSACDVATKTRHTYISSGLARWVSLGYAMTSFIPVKIQSAAR